MVTHTSQDGFGPLLGIPGISSSYNKDHCALSQGQYLDKSNYYTSHNKATRSLYSNEQLLITEN